MDKSSSPSSVQSQRRWSFAGHSLADMFSKSPSSSGPVGYHSSSPPPPPSSSAAAAAYPGQITAAAAAANAHRRRLSVTTATSAAAASSGFLSSSQQPAQQHNASASSPSASFGSWRPRSGSLSSINSSTVDESPFEEGDFVAPAASSSPSSSPTTSSSPFGRRLSFGARALRDVRASSSSSGNANGRINSCTSSPKAAESSVTNSASSVAFSPPSAKGRGEGFNVAENFRSRAERSSISGGYSPTFFHSRTRSMASASDQRPVKEAPKPVLPDPMQERILKGDFYLD